MELFLRGLSESPLLERPYQEAAIAAGDYPATTLDLRTEKDEVFFFSRPAGDRHSPWRVEASGRAYLVPDDSPLRALEILDPFLGRDPHTRAMSLLVPRAGEERASELWEKLEASLGGEEALAVVRRLSELLERGIAQEEVWQAAEEYVAKAAPPEPSGTEVAGGKATKAPLGEELLEAARKGDPAEVRAMVSAGMDADARGRDGKTALMLASEAGRASVVQALLESGANPNIQIPGGGTTLALAARNNQREAVRLLLQAGANPKLKDAHGVTPLMETVDANIIRALIRAGADVKAVDDKGLSALLRVVAAESSRAPSVARVEAVQSLLTAGADVRGRDREGRTALIWAVKGTPSSRSDPATVALLIQSGSELEARDREGGTALVYAAVRGDAKSSRLLVDAGADVNARMGNLSSLDIALRYGHSEIVTLLLRAGARR
jgi:ankyrin repeat protein